MKRPAHRASVWALVLSLVVAGAGIAAWAQAPAPGDTEDKSVTGPSPKTTVPEEAPDAAQAPDTSDTPDTPPSDADFIPSERIPADASIAFPVDI